MESHAFLHFEACYYQAVDYAIAHGLARVEAGAQGDHKIQRGYLPVPDLLGPLDRRSRLSPCGGRLPEPERTAVRQEIEGLMQYSPFRKENES